MRQAIVQILNTTNNGNQTGSAYDVNQAVSASFHPVCSDSAGVGSLKLQVSNDLVSNGNRATFVPTNWADIPNATSAISAGAGPMIVIGNMNMSYIRAVYTATSFTMTQVITFSAVPTSGHFRFNANGGTATMEFDNDAAGFQVLVRLISGCSNAVVTGNFTIGFTIVIPDATSALYPVFINNNTLSDGSAITVTMTETIPTLKLNMNMLSI